MTCSSLTGRALAEKVKVVVRLRPPLYPGEVGGVVHVHEDSHKVTVYRVDSIVPQSDFTFDRASAPTPHTVF